MRNALDFVGSHNENPGAARRRPSCAEMQKGGIFLNPAAENLFGEMERALEQVNGYSGTSDDDLMRAFQTGDVDAFEELVNRYRRPLTAFVTGILGDAGLAEDFAQEAFIRVWQEASDYLPMGRFRGWLYAIARNLCLNSLAGAHRHLGLTPDAPMVLWTWTEGSPAPDEGRSDEKEDLLREMETKTHSLPEKQKRVVLLRYYHGLSLEEIAETEDCPLGTVKSRLHHALARLREKMERFLCIAARSGGVRP